MPRHDPLWFSVGLCGRRPYVPDADVWEQPGGKELKVQCYEHFELEGEESVRCVGGKWTALPACTREYDGPQKVQFMYLYITCTYFAICFLCVFAAECEMDTSLFFQYSLGKYLKRGVQMSLRCSFASNHYIDVKCVNGKTLYKGCK